MSRDLIKSLIPIVIIEDESVPKIIMRFIEHNPDHSLKINLFGKSFNPCARCFGTWVGFISGLLLFFPFLFGLYYIDNFALVFSISWLFVIPSIADWTSVKLELREGDNNVRFIVGVLHGIGVILYFFVLPASILFKIITYAFYCFVFAEIRRRYKLKSSKTNAISV